MNRARRVIALLACSMSLMISGVGSEELHHGKDYWLLGCVQTPRLLRGQKARISLLAENFSNSTIVLQIGREEVDGEEISVDARNRSVTVRGEMIPPGKVAMMVSPARTFSPICA